MKLHYLEEKSKERRNAGNAKEERNRKEERERKLTGTGVMEKGKEQTWKDFSKVTILRRMILSMVMIIETVSNLQLGPNFCRCINDKRI